MAQPGPPGGISGSSLFPLPLNPGADGLSPVARETAVEDLPHSQNTSSLVFSLFFSFHLLKIFLFRSFHLIFWSVV